MISQLCDSSKPCESVILDVILFGTSTVMPNKESFRFKRQRPNCKSQVGGHILKQLTRFFCYTTDMKTIMLRSTYYGLFSSDVIKAPYCVYIKKIYSLVASLGMNRSMTNILCF